MDRIPDFIRFDIPVPQENERLGTYLGVEHFAVSRMVLPYVAAHVRAAGNSVRRIVERPVIWSDGAQPSREEKERYERYLRADIACDAMEQGLSVLAVSPLWLGESRIAPSYAIARMDYIAAPMVEWKEDRHG